MLSLRSLAFILCSAIRRARSLSCAALHCFPDRIRTMATNMATNMAMAAPMCNLLRRVYPPRRSWREAQKNDSLPGFRELLDPSALLRTYYDYAGLISLHTEDRMGNTQALIAEIYSA